MEEKGLVSQNMSDLYLPGTGYNNVELLICRSCVGPLVSYLKFAAICASTEEKITKYCGQIDTNSQDVKLNHVRMYKDNENEREILLKKRTLSGNTENNENNDIAQIMVCKSCVGQLPIYLKFATVCETTEEKITKYCGQMDTNGQDLLELNRVWMFCNQNESEILRKTTLFGMTGSNYRPTESDEVFGVPSVSCVVQHKTECLDSDAKRTCQSNSEVKMYECETCHFKTKRKGSLTVHRLVHKANPEVEMYECESCQFKTKHKGDLKKHLLVHKADCEVKMYECEMCPFKAKLKYVLKRHLLVHREASEVEMYKCEICPYESKYKRNLKHHLLVHSEMEMYECETCHFKTKSKRSLKSHRLVHRENSEVNMYECEMCPFKA
ncbi:hypothetical protein NQ317_001922 [Molorchus minor]|uniref:C2H2-type domain-containing protein n=1 Tax=Molorchus minor TaxID=1323400 RepID=A0ABQ9JF82_9CUCU|nr:hypothetical protein NQ317_001922 [Molorchus minor]